MPDVLRPGVLDGLTVCVVGGGAPIRERLAALGAGVTGLPHSAGAPAGVDVLVVDAAGPFAVAGGGMAGLRAAVDEGWDAVRDVAAASWTTGDAPGGKVVLVAPGADAGDHATAVGAALENLARTLSVEWARFGVRCTAVRPGSATGPTEIAELVAFVASPAGDYYSGCAFTMG